MANRAVTITMPDSFDRLIADGYEQLHVDNPTSEQDKAAFQEIVNLLALILPPQFGPDRKDDLYFRDMDENVRVWGHSRNVTREAQAIGSGYLTILKPLVESPAFAQLQKNTRRGEAEET